MSPQTKWMRCSLACQLSNRLNVLVRQYKQTILVECVWQHKDLEGGMDRLACMAQDINRLKKL